MATSQLQCSADNVGYGFNPPVTGGGFGDAFLSYSGGQQCLIKRDDGRFQFQPLSTVKPGVEILARPESGGYAFQHVPASFSRSSSTPSIQRQKADFSVETHVAPVAKMQLPAPTAVRVPASSSSNDGNRLAEENALRAQLGRLDFHPPERRPSHQEIVREEAALRADRAGFGKTPCDALQIEQKQSDRLRGRLLDVGQMFVGFDRAVEDDTRRRRAVELQRIGEIHEGLGRLERALNVEIKRRIEISKENHQACEHVLGDMLGRVQSRLLERFEHLTQAIESLQARCLTLERGMQQFRGELPSKLQVETVALIKALGDLGQDFDVDRRRRAEQDEYFLRSIDDAGYAVDVRMETELTALERRAESLQQLAEDFGASHAERDFAQEAILQDIMTLKTGLAKELKVRAQTDDEVVQAINEYTAALHRSIAAANN